jgi:hypothetical protein
VKEEEVVVEGGGPLHCNAIVRHEERVVPLACIRASSTASSSSIAPKWRKEAFASSSKAVSNSSSASVEIFFRMRVRQDNGSTRSLPQIGTFHPSLATFSRRRTGKRWSPTCAVLSPFSPRVDSSADKSPITASDWTEDSLALYTNMFLIGKWTKNRL